MSISISTAAMTTRRLFVIELLGKGMTQTDVALVSGMSLSTVKRWKKAFDAGGEAALAPKPHPGPRPKLALKERKRLCRLLLAGPRAAGFSTDLWTCRRVADVVRREFQVEYHPDHLGRILHDLGFSPQKPQRRASERDEQAIARWRQQDWPQIKKSASASGNRRVSR
jgi:transposase